MTQYIPQGYLDINQVIEMVGKSLFPDCWEDVLAKKDRYVFLNPEQKELIKAILDGNHSNEELILITISCCELEKSNSSPSKNIKYVENRLNFCPANQDNYKSMRNFYKSQEARDKIRDALSADKLTAYLLSEEDGEIKPLKANLWNVDENWHLLLLVRSIFVGKAYKFVGGLDLWIPSPTGKVIFKEEDIEDFLLSGKKMDSSSDATIVGQLLKCIEDGTIKLRGTERLQIRAKIEFCFENYQDKAVKASQTLQGMIEKLAKDINLTTITSIRKKFPNLKTMTLEELDQIDQNYVTKQEMKDIAKFLRPLHKQK